MNMNRLTKIKIKYKHCDNLINLHMNPKNTSMNGCMFVLSLLILTSLATDHELDPIIGLDLRTKEDLW